MSSSVWAWSAKAHSSPVRGARPLVRKASKPGAPEKSVQALAHCRAITGLTGKPSRAWRTASTNRSSKGSAPKRSDSAAQADTTPGTVTDSQPLRGIASRPLKRSGVQPAGERPEALSPCSLAPSQTSAKASPPMPFIVGSTTVSVIAAASAASMALPPRAKAAAPACAASGCEVAIRLRASTGWRAAGEAGVQFMPGVSRRPAGSPIRSATRSPRPVTHPATHQAQILICAVRITSPHFCRSAAVMAASLSGPAWVTM